MKTYAFFIAVLVANAFPASMYYTFTGTIGFVPEDRGGYAAAHGIRSGSPVTYIFEVDTAREAFTKFQGTKEPKPDLNNPGYAANYFFDSLITPSLFSPAVTDSASGSYLGYRIIITSGSIVRRSFQFQVTIGNPDKRAQVILSFPDTTENDFMPKIGTKAAGAETYIDSSVASSSATSTLTCTAISSTRPSLAVRPLPGRAARNRRADLSGERVYFGTGSAAFVDGNGRHIPFR
jgi:hypothetical protein